MPNKDTWIGVSCALVIICVCCLFAAGCLEAHNGLGVYREGRYDQQEQIKPPMFKKLVSSISNDRLYLKTADTVSKHPTIYILYYRSLTLYVFVFK